MSGAFEELKGRRMSEPVLTLTIDHGRYILDCDASDVVPGTVRMRTCYRVRFTFAWSR